MQLLKLWAFIIEYNFCLKEWQTTYSHSVFGNWQTFSLKWIKWACHFKENWQYLLPMIKSELSRENSNFGKPEFVTKKLTPSQVLKTFLMRLMVILINVTCLISCNQMCQNFKDLHSSVNFWMTNTWCYKITHRSKIHSKFKTDQ